ncbi:MAG: HPr(Ser) kinase/phosphatase [Firmicutes bacterium]|nr:HPr(Ser) kinase/phosphatase [Candidatus Colimorpha enterica]
MDENGKVYSIKLGQIIDEFGLEIINDKVDRNIVISRNEINRPGLVLSGFFDFFDPGRIQIIGLSEAEYIRKNLNDDLVNNLEKMFSTKPVAIIYTTSLEIPQIVLDEAEKYDTPLLRTSRRTSEFSSALIAYLSVNLAPRITRHGVLVEVYGEGILILGDSGIGKSETAIELVKRGHRLIADDAVEIKKVSAISLVGSSPEIIRHYVELRGIGIVDVKRIFGMGAVKDTEKIDMIIKLEPWEEGKMYDRFGLDQEYTEIMGINIPTTLIPVRPGRNLAIIIEVAAMNNRQKKMGYDTAKEFNERLLNSMNDQ